MNRWTMVSGYLTHIIILGTTGFISHGKPMEWRSSDICMNYTVLSDLWRETGSEWGGNCDSRLTEGWYRLMTSSGQPLFIPTVCLKNGVCGAEVALWLDLMGSDMPQPGHTTPAAACGSYPVLGLWQCCVIRHTAYVHNCGAFYVYWLRPTDRCSVGYCGKGRSVRLASLTVKTGERVASSDRVRRRLPPGRNGGLSDTADSRSIRDVSTTAASLTCAPNYVACDDGLQCIHEQYRCDIYVDCSDRSDEINCPNLSRCPEDLHRCSDGACVALPSDCTTEETTTIASTRSDRVMRTLYKVTFPAVRERTRTPITAHITNHASNFSPETPTSHRVSNSSPETPISHRVGNSSPETPTSHRVSNSSPETPTSHRVSNSSPETPNSDINAHVSNSSPETPNSDINAHVSNSWPETPNSHINAHVSNSSPQTPTSYRVSNSSPETSNSDINAHVSNSSPETPTSHVNPHVSNSSPETPTTRTTILVNNALPETSTKQTNGYVSNSLSSTSHQITNGGSSSHETPMIHTYVHVRNTSDHVITTTSHSISTIAHVSNTMISSHRGVFARTALIDFGSTVAHTRSPYSMTSPTHTVISVTASKIYDGISTSEFTSLGGQDAYSSSGVFGTVGIATDHDYLDTRYHTTIPTTQLSNDVHTPLTDREFHISSSPIEYPCPYSTCTGDTYGRVGIAGGTQVSQQPSTDILTTDKTRSIDHDGVPSVQTLTPPLETHGHGVRHDVGGLSVTGSHSGATRTRPDIVPTRSVTEVVTDQTEAPTYRSEALTNRTETRTDQTEARTYLSEASTYRTEAVAYRSEALTYRTEALTYRTEAVAYRTEAPTYHAKVREDVASQSNDVTSSICDTCTHAQPSLQQLTSSPLLPITLPSQALSVVPNILQSRPSLAETSSSLFATVSITQISTLSSSGVNTHLTPSDDQPRVLYSDTLPPMSYTSVQPHTESTVSSSGFGYITPFSSAHSHPKTPTLSSGVVYVTVSPPNSCRQCIVLIFGLVHKEEQIHFEESVKIAFANLLTRFYGRQYYHGNGTSDLHGDTFLKDHVHTRNCTVTSTITTVRLEAEHPSGGYVHSADIADLLEHDDVRQFLEDELTDYGASLDEFSEWNYGGEEAKPYPTDGPMPTPPPPNTRPIFVKHFGLFLAVIILSSFVTFVAVVSLLYVRNRTRSAKWHCPSGARYAKQLERTLLNKKANWHVGDVTSPIPDVDILRGERSMTETSLEVENTENRDSEDGWGQVCPGEGRGSSGAGEWRGPGEEWAHVVPLEAAWDNQPEYDTRL